MGIIGFCRSVNLQGNPFRSMLAHVQTGQPQSLGIGSKTQKQWCSRHGTTRKIWHGTEGTARHFFSARNGKIQRGMFWHGTARHGNPAILINIRNIWECRSRKVRMEEINLGLFAGNFWLVISRTVWKPCPEGWLWIPPFPSNCFYWGAWFLPY